MSVQRDISSLDSRIESLAAQLRELIEQSDALPLIAPAGEVSRIRDCLRWKYESLVRVYKEKFTEMKSNASTNEIDLEDVGMKLCQLYDEMVQLGTDQEINHRARAYDIHSTFFDFVERKCSNLSAWDDFYTDHERLCGKLKDIESRIMSLNIPSIRSDWGRRIARLKHRWIKFYEGQLKELPDRFASYSDAESIAQKLNNLYSEMTKLEPESLNNWQAKIQVLREHLIDFLSNLLAKLPLSCDSLYEADVIFNKLKTFGVQGPYIDFLSNLLAKLPLSCDSLYEADVIFNKLKTFGVQGPYIDFLSNLLAKLPVSYESYPNAEVICGKLETLYSDTIRTDPPSSPRFQATIIKLKADLVERKRFKWAPHVPDYKLDKGNLFFVDRTSSIHLLLDVFKKNDAKKSKGSEGVGSAFRIPLIDQVLGMGKTHFGYNFIHQCSKLESDLDFDKDYIEHISRARTLNVPLGNSSMLLEGTSDDIECRKRGWDTQLRKAISDNLKTKDSSLEACLAADIKGLEPTSATCVKLLQRLIERTGGDPVFIVLDEVGAAFYHPKGGGVISRRNLFIEFCSVVLSDWLTIPNLYFLIVGRGDVFDMVGCRLIYGEDYVYPSPFEFCRIPLGMIRSQCIGEILEYTTMKKISPSGNSEVSLNEYYELTNPDKIKNAIAAIIEQTNGHPRSILDMLAACTSYHALMNYKEKIEMIREFLSEVIHFKDSISVLLSAVEENILFDLCSPLNDRNGKKSLTYAVLADRARLRWEGKVSDARLHASPQVLSYLKLICSSFRMYLSHFGSHSEILYQKDRILEILLIKRFQEMFQLPCTPGEQYPTWFAGSEFGCLKSVIVHQSITGFPRITRGVSLSTPAAIHSKSAHPQQWGELRKEMIERGLACYLPLPESSSSDGFILTYGGNSENSKCETNVLITIGIAAKCLKNKLNMPEILREIELFNGMFNESAQPPGAKRKCGDELRVLVICCTGGYVRPIRNLVQRKFAKCTFDKQDFPQVSEVLLMDLSSEEDRAHFFGIGDNSILRKNLENLIS
jgi:hypothetical protein